VYPTPLSICHLATLSNAQVMDGKNIADFVDPDIEERLAELEAEEEAQLAAEGERGVGGRRLHTLSPKPPFHVTLQLPLPARQTPSAWLRIRSWRRC